MSLKLEHWPSKAYSYTLPMRYRLWGPAGQGLVLCMHGYQDHALSMMKRLGWAEQPELPFQVLAVNAPFPVPIWTASGFLEAYSWYFRDSERGFTIVSPQETALRVYQLVQDLGLADLPMVIFGFSQGGYLAPFLAPHCKNLKSIIAIGSGFPPEPYKHLLPTSVYAIHGDQDERIPIAPTQEALAHLKTLGHKTEFFTIPGLGHRVDAQMEPLVRQLASASFSS